MKRNLRLITITMLAVSLAFAACGEKNGGNGGIAGLLALLTGNNTVRPGAKTLVSFSIVSPASTGVIDESAKTVSVSVPYGTDVTALTATFTTTGASVKVGTTVQVSGVTANDFMNPVTYTVTAADGSTQDYVVTVTVAAVNAKEITAFSFTSAKNPGLSADITGTIGGTSIAVTVPYGTTVTALVATYTTTGASVAVGSTAQTSGVSANDFTNPVTYTVTAADGSTQDYTVTVTVAAASAKAITAFSFTSAKNSGLSADITGTISGTSIAVTVPYGTTVATVKTLVATFATTGASVAVGSTTQVSGVSPNDFTSPVTYTVTAADGSTQDYTVTVTVASASAKEITAFSFPSVTWSIQLYSLNHTNGNDLGTAISGTSITAKLPYGSTTMVATFATTGASVTVSGVPQVSGVTSNDFKNQVTYRVTAADGSWQDYTVTVLFVPAVNCVENSLNGGVLSSWWIVTDSTSTLADSVSIGLTCDAINAGSDTFTMEIIMGYGCFTPYLPGAVIGPPYLTIPSDTTVTYIDGDERHLEIVGPLNSMQYVIAQLRYVPPGYAASDFPIVIFLTDKNGLRARGRINMTVFTP